VSVLGGPKNPAPAEPGTGHPKNLLGREGRPPAPDFLAAAKETEELGRASGSAW